MGVILKGWVGGCQENSLNAGHSLNSTAGRRTGPPVTKFHIPKPMPLSALAAGRGSLERGVNERVQIPIPGVCVNSTQPRPVA